MGFISGSVKNTNKKLLLLCYMIITSFTRWYLLVNTCYSHQSQRGRLAASSFCSYMYVPVQHNLEQKSIIQSISNEHIFDYLTTLLDLLCINLSRGCTSGG